MEGDNSDLPAIGEISQTHSTSQIHDEPHAVGAHGERGPGTCDLYGHDDRDDLLMRTISKTLATCGGYIARPADVIRVPQERLQSNALRQAQGAWLLLSESRPASVGGRAPPC